MKQWEGFLATTKARREELGIVLPGKPDIDAMDAGEKEYLEAVYTAILILLTTRSQENLFATASELFEVVPPDGNNIRLIKFLGPRTQEFDEPNVIAIGRHNFK